MPAPKFANSPEALGLAPGDYPAASLSSRLPAALESEIRRIYDRSPLYGRRFPLHAEPLQWSCYREIPALSKREIVEHGHQAFFADYGVIERGLQDRRFEYEATGGTTQFLSADGTLTTAGSLVKQANKPLAGTLTSAGTTRAPSLTNTSTTAAPMPRDPPMTIATLPSSLPVMLPPSVKNDPADNASRSVPGAAASQPVASALCRLIWSYQC